MKSIKMVASALMLVLMLGYTPSAFSQTDQPDNSSTSTATHEGNEYNADMGKGNHDYEASGSGWLGLLGLIGLVGLLGLRKKRNNTNP